jgi:hypothetical protein
MIKEIALLLVLLIFCAIGCAAPAASNEWRATPSQRAYTEPDRWSVTPDIYVAPGLAADLAADTPPGAAKSILVHGFGPKASRTLQFSPSVLERKFSKKSGKILGRDRRIRINNKAKKMY